MWDIVRGLWCKNCGLWCKNCGGWEKLAIPSLALVSEGRRQRVLLRTSWVFEREYSVNSHPVSKLNILCKSPSKSEFFSDLSCFAMPRGIAKQTVTVDWNAFVHESDPEVNCDYAKLTRTKIRLVKTSSQKYVALIYWVLLLTYRARFMLQHLKPGDYKYCFSHNVEDQSGFLVFARYWRIFWCMEMDRLFNYDLRRRMTKVR